MSASTAVPSEKFKVVLLGEGRVGKTSILLRYIKNEYNDRQVSTIQASYLDKKISVNGTDVLVGPFSLSEGIGSRNHHSRCSLNTAV